MEPNELSMLDIRAFITGRASAEVKRRIAEDLSGPDSRVKRVLQGMSTAASNALVVDWKRLAIDLGSERDADRRAPVPNALEGVVQTLLTVPQAAQPGDATIVPARDEIARYLLRDLDHLTAEFGHYLQTEVCHSPISPYIEELRRVICEEWGWAKHRNAPEMANPQQRTEAVWEALVRSKVQVPFPLPLVAAFLVKADLDILCDLD